MFCLEGSGAISHMSIRNRPDVYNEPSMFAAISLKGLKNGVKILEGPIPEWKLFGQPGTGNGAAGTTFGLPRFKNVSFTTKFPFAMINLQDEDIPMQIKLTGWSPFIPTDHDNSSLPAGALEYVFKNTSTQKIDAVFSYNAKNFLATEDKVKNSISKIANGFILEQEGTTEKPQLKGSFAAYTSEANTI